MAGREGRLDPQHYIARFTVASTAVAAPRLECCCVAIDAIVRLDAAARAAMGAMRLYRESLTAAGQARARAAAAPTFAARAAERACFASGDCADYAWDVGFLRLPTRQPDAELWRMRQGDCIYAANCG